MGPGEGEEVARGGRTWSWSWLWSWTSPDRSAGETADGRIGGRTYQGGQGGNRQPSVVSRPSSVASRPPSVVRHQAIKPSVLPSSPYIVPESRWTSASEASEPSAPDLVAASANRRNRCSGLATAFLFVRTQRTGPQPGKASSHFPTSHFPLPTRGKRRPIARQHPAAGATTGKRATALPSHRHGTPQCFSSLVSRLSSLISVPGTSGSPAVPTHPTIYWCHPRSEGKPEGRKENERPATANEEKKNSNGSVRSSACRSAGRYCLSPPSPSPPPPPHIPRPSMAGSGKVQRWKR